MGMAGIGIFFACTAILASKRLGLNWRGGATPLWLAVLCFAAGLAIPPIAVISTRGEPSNALLIAHGCTVLGALLLFVACAAFTPRDAAD